MRVKLTGRRVSYLERVVDMPEEEVYQLQNCVGGFMRSVFIGELLESSTTYVKDSYCEDTELEIIGESEDKV